MTYILIYAFIYLSFAVLAVLVSQKLGLGSVLGYLMAGVIIGPLFGWVGKETETIQHIAEFGVVMMLFLVGLEMAPQMLWRMRHKLLGLGGLQVGLTLAVLAGAALLMGFGWKAALAAGCILALSSTAIVLQTYGEKGLMQTQGGQAGFAVLLFQDVAAIPMLALLPLLGTAAANEAQQANNLLDGQAGWVLAAASAAVMALIVVGVRYLVPRVFRFISKTRLNEMFTMFTLALVVGIAALMSLLGLSPALGAFIAGVSLANSSYRHELESHLQPFKGLLLGLFFITVGASMNFALLARELLPVFGLTLAVMLVKILVLLVLARLFRLPPLSGKLFALSLAQAGEFGFVLLSIAGQSRILPSEWHDRISLVVALSMLLTPLLFIFYERVLAQRAISGENEARAADHIDTENPIILIGHGRFGQHVNSMLTACGFTTTVVDNNAEMVEGVAKYGMKTYFGDATRPELLNALGLAQAKLLVLTLANREKSLEILEFVRRHYPELPVLARAYDRLHAYRLHQAGADYIIRETAESAMRSGRIALECMGVPAAQARELEQFYAARERYQMEKGAAVYDPELSIFANEAMLKQVFGIREETVQMMQALLRGEQVDWQENPESWVRRKKGMDGVSG